MYRYIKSYHKSMQPHFSRLELFHSFSAFLLFCPPKKRETTFFHHHNLRFRWDVESERERERPRASGSKWRCKATLLTSITISFLTNIMNEHIRIAAKFMSRSLFNVLLSFQHTAHEHGHFHKHTQSFTQRHKQTTFKHTQTHTYRYTLHV